MRGFLALGAATGLGRQCRWQWHRRGGPGGRGRHIRRGRVFSYRELGNAGVEGFEVFAFVVACDSGKEPDGGEAFDKWRSGRADPSVGDHHGAAGALGGGNAVEVLEDAIDVCAEGVRNLAAEVAGIDLADHRGKHEEAQEAEPVRASQGGGDLGEVVAHRPADIEVDVGDRERCPLDPFLLQGAPEDHGPCTVEGFP